MNSSAPPPVIKWYRLYAGAMAVLYILLVLLSFLGFFIKPTPQELEGHPLWAFKLVVAIFFIMCAVFAGLYLYAFRLSNTPKAWVYHLVLICIGLTSPCCMLASIPLLIFWIKPDTQIYFGRRPAATPSA